MSYVIRKGTQNDVPGILALIRELAAFERQPDAVINTEKMLLEDGFGNNPLYQVIVAEELSGNNIIGMALYYTAYSTWKGRFFYLDDLIVTQEYRSMGIGKQLLDVFLKEAHQANVQLVKWQVLDWNTPAIEFYKKMGAQLEPEWLNCKMTIEEITQYLDTKTLAN